MPIGVVYPTYYNCLSNYNIVGTNDKLISDWAQDRKVELLPRINCQSATVLHAILTDPTRRAAVISQLMSIVKTNGYEPREIVALSTELLSLLSNEIKSDSSK